MISKNIFYEILSTFVNMRPRKLFLACIIIALIIPSCDSIRIEKRRYMKGFYVNSSRSKVLPSIKEKLHVPIAISSKAVDSFDLASVSSIKQEGYASSIDAKKNNLELSTNSQKGTNLIQNINSKNNSIVSPKTTSNGKIHVNEKEHFNNERNANYLLSGMVAFFSVLFFGLLKWKKKTALKISKWASRRKWKTRFIIAGLHLVLAVVGHYAGSFLGDLNVFISDFARDIIMGGFLLGILIYPRKNRGLSIYDAKQYLKKKVFDFILVLSGFLLTVCHGNDLAKPNLSDKMDQGIQSFSNATDQKMATNDFIYVPIDETGAMILKGVLIFLAVLLILVLQALIVVYSCALSCSGQEGAAYALLIGGTVLLALLAVLAFTGIANIKADKPDTT